MRALTATVIIAICSNLSAQTDSFLHDGVYRSYIVHTPSGWQQGDTVPLVINMHGFGATAQSQQIYSLMDFVADTAGFIVVYPQGVNNSWDFTGFSVDDLGFIDKLIDTLSKDYRVDLDRVYACGMSNGGFMSYTLACELSDRIVAIASVAASMSVLQTFSCAPGRAVPVFELHGTSDTIVPYGGGFGVSSVDDLISFWRTEDGCTPQVDSLDFPDVITFDDCTVTAFRWENCDDESEVWLYRVNNGGHTWPGTFPVPGLGPTNLDLIGSVEIWEFFRKFRFDSQQPSSVKELQHGINVIPNPASDFVVVEGMGGADLLELFSLQGARVRKSRSNVLMTHDLPNGSYVMSISSGSSSSHALLVIQH